MVTAGESKFSLTVFTYNVAYRLKKTGACPHPHSPVYISMSASFFFNTSTKEILMDSEVIQLWLELYKHHGHEFHGNLRLFIFQGGMIV